MERNDPTTAPPEPWCPSADPSQPDSVVLGVVGGTATAPQLGYLVAPLPVSDALLALAAPVAPSEVFRFAAPCAGAACAQFDRGRCRLATKIVQGLPAVVAALPVCRLRPACRWWQQEGAAACHRCPQVVRESYHASAALRQAADPTSP